MVPLRASHQHYIHRFLYGERGRQCLLNGHSVIRPKAFQLLSCFFASASAALPLRVYFRLFPLRFRSVCPRVDQLEHKHVLPLAR
jgi:hypothetical protein